MRSLETADRRRVTGPQVLADFRGYLVNDS